MSMKLQEMIAKACHYAQEHVGCPDAWPTDESERECLLEVTSFQVACFLAQNTVYGHEGVGWEIVIAELTDPTVNKQGMMVKSETEWLTIINGLAKEFGGWI